MNTKLKVILVGDGRVGKTSLINQFVKQTFKTDYIMNTSADKYKKEIEIDDITLNLEIWDTIGQEIYASINKIFMKNSNIAILVYDITSQESFFKLDNWFQQIIDINNKNNIIIGMCGNKSDLFEKEKVNKDDAKKFALDKKIPFFETSAKDYQSIFNVFNQLCKEYIKKEKELQKRIINNQLDINDTELIANRNNRKKSLYIHSNKNHNNSSNDNNDSLNNSNGNNNTNIKKKKNCC